MAEMDNTTSGIIWQWLSEHKQDVLDYFATIMREASDIQLVNFDADRHMGLLATFVYQGVRRVDNVKPSSLVEGLTRLNEELRRRCEAAAAEAERQGTYAKTQGDRVDACIAGYNQLYQRVKSQGDTAEQQGANAQSIYDTVRNWYSPFKTGAESWLSDTKADWYDWNGSTRDAWDSWYDARLKQWRDWFTDGVVPDWNDFWASVQQDWHNWTEAELARQEAELERIDNELARMAAERIREASEQERQRQEGIRQRNESVREQQEAERELAEDKRQQTFEENEAQRQQDFEDAETRRMENMLVTEFYVDFDDMTLTILQPEADTVEYDVEDGYLFIEIEYDDGEEEPEEQP